MKRIIVLIIALVIVSNGSVLAATPYELTGSCPGSSNTWKTVFHYNDDGKVESIEHTDCNGIIVVTTYSYDLKVKIDLVTDGSSNVTYNGSTTQFKVDKVANVVIKNGATGNIDHAYSGTVSAHTWTSLPSLVTGELYVLIASNPSTGVYEAAAVYVDP